MTFPLPWRPVLSGDGNIVATVSDGVIEILRADVGPMGVIDPESDVFALALSPTGQTVAVAGKDTTSVFSTTTMARRSRPAPVDGPLQLLAVSDAGDTVAVTERASTATLRHGDGTHESVPLAGIEARYASWSAAGALLVWGHGARTYDAVLVTVGLASETRRWSSSDAAMPDAVLRGWMLLGERPVCYAEDRIFVLGDDGSTWTERPAGPAEYAASSPGGSYVATLGNLGGGNGIDYRLACWDAAGHEVRRGTFSGLGSFVQLGIDDRGVATVSSSRAPNQWLTVRLDRNGTIEREAATLGS